MTRAALALAASAVLSGCCCFGDFASIPDPDANPPPGDAQPIAVAREHARREADRLLSRDGGTCDPATLAIETVGASATRGRAGGAQAARVIIEVAGCVARIWVTVIWRDHAWIAVDVQFVDGAGTVLARTEPAGPHFVQEDLDLGSDELFD